MSYVSNFAGSTTTTGDTCFPCSLRVGGLHCASNTKDSHMPHPSIHAVSSIPLCHCISCNMIGPLSHAHARTHTHDAKPCINPHKSQAAWLHASLARCPRMRSPTRASCARAKEQSNRRSPNCRYLRGFRPGRPRPPDSRYLRPFLTPKKTAICDFFPLGFCHFQPIKRCHKRPSFSLSTEKIRQQPYDLQVMSTPVLKSYFHRKTRKLQPS